MPSRDKLDHTVINVKYGMDDAETLFAGLGFTLTPRGFHSHGSMNHLMMFGTDYLELIGIPEGKEIERQDLKTAPLGINGLVFKAADVDDIFARLQDAGFAGDPPRAFHRPVDIDGGQRDAKFRTVTARPDVFAGGRVYFCEHGTPDLVWRPEWQDHANGVVAIPECINVAVDTDGEAARFAALLGTEVEMDAQGQRYAALDGCRVTTLSPEQYAARYGDLASNLDGRAAIFGALVFTTADLAAATARAESLDAVTVAPFDGRTVVRIAAYDAIVEYVAA